ncbi:methyltransferase domain-containing protein [Streptomyces radicis]|uniref:Class I SAM-dependent methyltransferase n=1 Tax=Streptomyces radicis TaxID=1750517 RepID=A0A3A9WIY3_9ACTN|nr:methyltransferase domain-containing protein [Streptomyces radicis]RKN12729.1 class I SAM-dependent methyltransferase [Streptomyces radicis]RKN27509.1 class I SAM-dependent methyltransferase [Streptomyces radicis]
MTATEDRLDPTERNRRYWDGAGAAAHGPLARDQWAATEPRWGLWATPESELRLLPDDLEGTRVVELGCGTAYVSAWLARRGARPVGVDISAEQLATARAMQEEFGQEFPLVRASAEEVPYEDGAFDLAISEFGASLWCDPYRWIPEAARLLVPGGRLVFGRYSPLFALCARPAGPAATELRRDLFGMRRLDRGDRVEFVLPHGDMLRLLRSSGFEVLDLIEIRAPRPAHRDYGEVTADWAQRWPSEEIWVARRHA